MLEDGCRRSQLEYWHRRMPTARGFPRMCGGDRKGLVHAGPKGRCRALGVAVGPRLL